MHVHHLPHQLHRTVLTAAAAALLALVIALAISGRLVTINSTSASGAAPPAAHLTGAVTLSPLMNNPLIHPLTHTTLTAPFPVPARQPLVLAPR